MALQRRLFAGLKRRNKLFSSRFASNQVNPMTKTWKILSREIPATFGFGEAEVVYPEHADVVIVGGGFIGASAAYWLKTRAVHGLNVVVIDRDTAVSDLAIEEHCLTRTTQF